MTILDKVKELEKYIASGKSAVDPVMDIALDKLLEREIGRMLELRIRLANQLKEFEEKYALVSSDFYRCYENGEMGDATDFVEWAATVEMLVNTERWLALLRQDADSCIQLLGNTLI
ncbi:MAG: hypothetical protein AB1611_16395 [bacterium]